MSGQVTWQARFESARSNRLFELFIILVIIASALLVGVKTYQLPSWVKPVTVSYTHLTLPTNREV